jgi:hypothetical protein
MIWVEFWNWGHQETKTHYIQTEYDIHKEIWWKKTSRIFIKVLTDKNNNEM